MVLVHLILENQPEETITLKQLSKFISKDFSKILLKSINEKRDLRFKRAKDFKYALEKLFLKKLRFFN
jgi:hypothetical protein